MTKLRTQYSYLTSEELVSLIYLPGNVKLDPADLITELTWRLISHLPKHKATTMMHLMPETLQAYFRDGWNDNAGK